MADGQKRVAVRRRTFLNACITYGDEAFSAECWVNQLSDRGARLSIASSVALTDKFEIAIPQKQRSHRAKLVWRTDDQAGIEFIENKKTGSSASAKNPAIRLQALEAENAGLKAQLGILLQQVARLTET